MNLDPRRIAPIFLALVTACGPVVSGGGAPPPPPSARCDGTRWIGITPTCAPLPGWSAAPLFSNLPAPLADYCVYEWTDPNLPAASDLLALQGAGALALGEDCPVVVPQATSYEGALARSLRASLHAQVGTVEGVGLRRPAAGQPVKVVVVDTAPDSLLGGPLPVGNDRHGDTLANIVHDVACGPLGCAAEPATALALPWLDENTFSSGGGHAGRLSDLALALMRAFDAGAAKGGQQHLILNLAAGLARDIEQIERQGNKENDPPTQAGIQNDLRKRVDARLGGHRQFWSGEQFEHHCRHQQRQVPPAPPWPEPTDH